MKILISILVLFSSSVFAKITYLKCEYYAQFNLLTNEERSYGPYPFTIKIDNIDEKEEFVFIDFDNHGYCDGEKIAIHTDTELTVLCEASGDTPEIFFSLNRIDGFFNEKYLNDNNSTATAMNFGNCIKTEKLF